MPSQDTIEDNGRLGSGGHDKNGNVTQPFVTEAYRCLSPYETKDTKNRPFKVALDENVDVLIKDKAGETIFAVEGVRWRQLPCARILYYHGRKIVLETLFNILQCIV